MEVNSQLHAPSGEKPSELIDQNINWVQRRFGSSEEKNLLPLPAIKP
jgi:hypothetical protein